MTLTYPIWLEPVFLGITAGVFVAGMAFGALIQPRNKNP